VQMRTLAEIINLWVMGRGAPDSETNHRPMAKFFHLSVVKHFERKACICAEWLSRVAEAQVEMGDAGDGGDDGSAGGSGGGGSGGDGGDAVVVCDDELLGIVGENGGGGGVEKPGIYSVIKTSRVYSTTCVPLTKRPPTTALMESTLTHRMAPPRLEKHSVLRRLSASREAPWRSAEDFMHSMYANATGVSSIMTSA